MFCGGITYGYRKLHDDLLDHGETCCPNRVARLTRIAGIKAQIGYKRRPGVYGGSPSIVIDYTLDRQFDVVLRTRRGSRTIDADITDLLPFNFAKTAAV